MTYALRFVRPSARVAFFRWALLAMLAATALGACASTGDRVSRVPEGAARDEVIALLGSPTPDDALPLGRAGKLPEGCVTELIYKDRYDNGTLRWAAERVSTCGGTWFHVCFDGNGKAMRGMRFTMITC